MGCTSVLPIRTGVKNPAILLKHDKSLKDDECQVRIQGRNILLSGKDEWGLLYAVYAFLENQIGVRWYTAYDDEKVPRYKTLKLDFKSYRERPAYPWRGGMCYYYYQTKDSNMFFLRNRMNYQRNLRNPRYPGSKEKYMPVGDGAHTLFYYIPVRKGFYPQRLKFKTEKYYFAEHPEYFSMDKNGKRTEKLQLCFSNKELRKEFTRRFYECFSLMKPKGVYSISSMDWPGSFCYCTGCQALEKKYKCNVGPLLDYLIELCNDIKDKYPEIYISTLAYRKNQSEVPPVIKGKLPENLVIDIAPIDDDFSKILTHKNNIGTLKNIQNWVKIATYTNFWYYPLPYGNFLPHGGLNRAVEDTRILRETGVTGVIYEHDVGVFEGLNFGDLMNWVLIKMFQDPWQDHRKLVREFCDFYYGEAADDIISYMDELEKYTKDYPIFHIWNGGAVRSALTPENLYRWNLLFDKMEAKTAKNKAALDRVRDVRIALDLAILYSWQKLNEKYPGKIPTIAELEKRVKTNLETALDHRIPPEKAVAKRVRRNWVLNVLEQALVIASIKYKPLPPPFDKIPAAKVRQTYPKKMKRVTVVDDPAAPFGYAICNPKKPLEVPFTLGVYDNTNQKFLLSTQIKKEQIVPDKYHFYKVGSVPFPPKCVLWTTSTWTCYFDLDPFYTMGESLDKKYEVWISIKFEGPGYSAKSTKKVNRALLGSVIAIDK